MMDENVSPVECTNGKLFVVDVPKKNAMQDGFCVFFPFHDVFFRWNFCFFYLPKVFEI